MDIETKTRIVGQVLGFTGIVLTIIFEYLGFLGLTGIGVVLILAATDFLDQ